MRCFSTCWSLASTCCSDSRIGLTSSAIAFWRALQIDRGALLELAQGGAGELEERGVAAPQGLGRQRLKGVAQLLLRRIEHGQLLRRARPLGGDLRREPRLRLPQPATSRAKAARSQHGPLAPRLPARRAASPAPPGGRPARSTAVSASASRRAAPDAGGQPRHGRSQRAGPPRQRRVPAVRSIRGQDDTPGDGLHIARSRVCRPAFRLTMVPPMRIFEGEIQRLATSVVSALLKQGFVHPKVDEKQLRDRVAALLLDNLQARRRSSRKPRNWRAKARPPARRHGPAQDRRGHQGPAGKRTGFYTVMRVQRRTALASRPPDRRDLQKRGAGRGGERAATCWRRSSAALQQDTSATRRLDEIVRRKIASLSRKVPPGSREWDILYQRYLDEEQRKQKS